MNEQLERHPVLKSLVLILCVVVYFFAGAEPLSKEYVARPSWRTAFQPVAASGVLPDAYGFSKGDWYGFIAGNGSLVLGDKVAGGAVVSDWGYVASMVKAEPGQLRELRGPDGGLLGSLKGGSPFFSSGRLFSASMDGTTLSSHRRDGSSAWTHAFPSQISAFAANDELAIGGTVDGWLEAVNTRGERVLRFSPGGSRLPVILGVGISPSSAWIAMLSGLDTQRLVVLGRGKSDYRVVSHRYLESSFREPAKVAVLGDDRHVLYRHPEGVGVWEVSGKTSDILPVKADDFDVYYHPEQSLAYLVVRYAGASELVVFRPPAKLLGRIDLGKGLDVVRIDAATVYLATSEAVARLDFIEE
jgi:hypothetical protein